MADTLRPYPSDEELEELRRLVETPTQSSDRWINEFVKRWYLPESEGEDDSSDMEGELKTLLDAYAAEKVRENNQELKRKFATMSNREFAEELTRLTHQGQNTDNSAQQKGGE